MSPPRFILALPRDRPPTQGIVRETNPLVKPQATAWLWASDAMPVADAGDGSVVIGHCFSRAGPKNGIGWFQHSSDATQSAKSLLRKGWGAYFAVLPDVSTNRWQVMSDPSGLLPVFRLLTSSHVILSSDPALFQGASGLKPEVCWRRTLHHLMQPDLRQRATCLAGVDELPPGVLLDPSSPDAPEQVLWSPSDHFPANAALTFESAREELRAVACNVLDAWQMALGPVAVAVSGGVDSSFICGALAAGGREFGCITLATAEAGGDERYFARLLANHLDRPLMEFIYDPAALTPQSFASKGMPRPSRRTFVMAVDTMLARGAAELAAAVVLDGNAGDNLFCYLHSAVPVVDRLRSEGPGFGTFSTLLDMCRVTGCDIPTMAKETLRKLRQGCSAPSFFCDTRLLTTDAHSDSEIEPLVSWPENVHGPCTGKHDHVALIMRARHNIHGISSRVPRLSPLMSQPLLETCLRIPTWLWPTGGVNRALARAAFASELPAELFTRTAKPGPDGFIRQAFERNRSQLHVLLREGLLVKNGLLDTTQLDRVFAGETANDWKTVRRLLDLAEAENWAKSWQA